MENYSYIKLGLLSLLWFPNIAFATDIDMLRLISKVNNSEKRQNSFMLAGEDGVSTDEDSLKIEPALAVGEDSLSPAITFSTDKEIGAHSNIVFGLTASAQPDLDEPEEIVQKYVLDGGDINFHLVFQNSPYKDFGWSLGARYSSVTASEIPAEGSTYLKVDSETMTYSLGLSYAFNSAQLNFSFNHHQSYDNGEEATFDYLVDDKNSTVFGVSLPFSKDESEYYLKFQRAKLTDVDEAEFRIVIETKTK